MERSAHAQGNEPETPRIAVIVHKSNLAPMLAEKELEGIFLFERRFWLANSRIRIIQRKFDTELFRIFTQRVLPDYVNELPGLCRARRNSVRYAESDDDALAMVSQYPGAIGYVWEQSVTPAVRVIALLELINPTEGMAPARTARLMGTLRGLWDQLSSSLRNPKMPVEDLQLMARAVAAESADVMRFVPKGADESTAMFAGLAQKLKEQTAQLSDVVQDRREALRRMSEMERKLCMECHTAFRQ